MVDGWRRAGREVHSGAGRRPSAPTAYGPFEAVNQIPARSPVLGDPRCCCVRVCQSPVLIPGSGGRRACSHLQRVPLQEAARRKKVLCERVAESASTSMPPPWPARSPTRTGRRRRWRRWPRRWRRGEKLDRRHAASEACASDGGQWRWCRCCRRNRRRSERSPTRNGGSRRTDVVPGSQVPSGRREATPNMVGGEKFTMPTVRVPHRVMQVTMHFPNWRMR